MNNFFNISKDRINLYPDPHRYETVGERVLWALNLLSKETSEDSFSYGDIAKFLTDQLEIATTPQAVRMASRRFERGLVTKNKAKIKIMRKGREIIENQGNQSVHYIEAGKPYSGKKMIATKIIQQLRGTIKICDPYVDLGTLDLLSFIPKQTKVELLTVNIYEKPKDSFKRSVKDMKREGRTIDVKINSSNDLHDRYIIDQSNMWLIGQSIKDLGKKECFITEAGPEVRKAVLLAFDNRFAKATPI